MCTKPKKESVSIAALKEQEMEECRYSLYSFSLEGVEKYVISAETEDQVDFQMVGGTREQAEALFKCICEGRVSCEHLSDVAEDYSRQIRCGAFQFFN